MGVPSGQRRLAFGFLGFKAARNLGFHVAVLQPFLLSVGVPIETVFLGLAVMAVTGVAMEVPTGAFADAFGRRTSLAAGTLVKCASYMLLFLDPTPLQAMLGFVLMRTGEAFVSGADSALLYDALKGGDQGRAYQKLEGWAYIVELVVYGAAAAAGSLVASRVDLGLPLLMTAVGTSLGIGFLLLLPRDMPERRATGHARRPSLAAPLRALRGDPMLRAAFVHFAAFAVLVNCGTALYQPLMMAQDVNVAWFGLAYAALVLIDAGGVALSGTARAQALPRRSTLRAVHAAFLLFLAPCLLAGWTGGAMAIVLIQIGFAFHALGDGLQHAPVRRWLNQAFEGPERATLISLATMASSLVAGAINACNGFLLGQGWLWPTCMPLLAVLAASVVVGLPVRRPGAPSGG